MLYVNTTSLRPDRLSSLKDEKYHVEYARWTLNTLNNPIYRKFIGKTLINWSFYKGGQGQWIFEEDLEGFFLDESGDVRNRIRMSKNLIKPMVLQYEGNAIRLVLNGKAKAVSDFTINRREHELGRLQFFEKAASTNPLFDKAVRSKFVLGKTPEETVEIFNNSWVNETEDDTNHLLQFIIEDVNMQQLKVEATRQLAMSGLAVYKGYCERNCYQASITDSMFFFWDMSAKKRDLSDAAFKGEWYYMDCPSMFEKWQHISSDNRKRLENYSRNQSIDIHRMVNNYFMSTGDRIPVYEVYWDDVIEEEYGWVKDQFGYPYYTCINSDDSPYTDKDLIDPPTPSHAQDVGDKKKTKIYHTTTRYCIFVPKEEVGDNNGGDIVLEFGEYEYQENYSMSPSYSGDPYKCETWSFDKGDVLSPLDDAIDPQRFTNRLISVAESQINNSSGQGIAISKDAIDQRDGEEGVTRNINKSKPIYVDTTRTGSIQNAVGQYGMSIGSGTMALFNIIKEMQLTMQEVTGINDAMTGTQIGSDALVGVIQSQIQRGSIQQEPFFYALSSLFMQAYQQAVTVGKKIYYNNPRRLAIIVGDKGMQNIVVTKDMLLEDFRIFIKRSESSESLINNGNSLLFTLLQAGLLDKTRFSNLFNRADADDIAKALREYQSELLQASTAADDNRAKANLATQQQMAAMAQRIQELEQSATDREDANLQADRDLEYDKAYLKEKAKNDREKIKYSGINGELPEGIS